VFLTVLRSSAVRENIPRGLPRGVFNSHVTQQKNGVPLPEGKGR
jgi:hypothetical protein